MFPCDIFSEAGEPLRGVRLAMRERRRRRLLKPLWLRAK
jgi:hypothetical protein